MESKVYIRTYLSPKVNKKEVLRYARCGEDEQSISLLDSCISEAEDVLSYRACYRRFPIYADGDSIDLGFAKVVSHSLALCLFGCDEVIVFCATVGVGIDRVIKKHSLISPSRAVMLQALGSERVEAVCDEFCREMTEELLPLNRTLRPRFSPGYGDLALDVQRDIFSALDITRNLGVSLGENLMMTPQKSVTAIIGIKKGATE